MYGGLASTYDFNDIAGVEMGYRITRKHDNGLYKLHRESRMDR